MQHDDYRFGKLNTFLLEIKPTGVMVELPLAPEDGQRFMTNSSNLTKLNLCKWHAAFDSLGKDTNYLWTSFYLNMHLIGRRD